MNIKFFRSILNTVTVNFLVSVLPIHANRPICFDFTLVKLVLEESRNVFDFFLLTRKV